MRLVAFILVIILFTSCTALKPIINKQSDNESGQRSAEPHFIENITLNSSSKNSAIKMEPADNYSVGKNIISMPGSGIELINPLQFKYAILMDLPVEELKNSNSRLLEFIEEWYGTPYHFGGSSKGGIDCSAFTSILMAAVFGADIPRMAKDQYKACRRVPRIDLEEGDLVFFHTTRRGVSHVGVYLGNNKFVHASLNYGVTISDLGDGYYARKLIGAGRLRQGNTSVSAN